VGAGHEDTDNGSHHHLEAEAGPDTVVTHDAMVYVMDLDGSGQTKLTRVNNGPTLPPAASD
jgi:hypothetical protein